MESPTTTIAPAKGAQPHGDALLIASWGRWAQALTLYNQPRDTKDGPQEEAWFNTICAEEEVMRKEVATTSRGAECQLWIVMENMTNGVEESLATGRADLDYYLAHDREHDWEVRLITAAIRSLRAQNGGAA